MPSSGDHIAVPRPEEVWAQICIQREFPDAQVTDYDDGSTSSMYDIQMVHPDGTVGAVEVTTASDRERIGLWKFINDRGDRWIEPNLDGGWAVRVQPRSAPRDFRAQLVALLRQAEQTGIRVIECERSSADHLAVLGRQLGLLETRQGATSFPGSIYVMPPELPDQTAGFVPPTGDTLAEWISNWIVESVRADNLLKLTRSGASERHLFVFVHPFNLAPFAVNYLLMATDPPAPILPPNLPDAVTHVWIMSTWSAGHGFRWSPDHGWTKFPKVPPKPTG